MNDRQEISLSLPDVWDLCLEKIYDKRAYLEGFIEALKERGIARRSLILDAGCGSGFPAIDLVKKGYRVVGVDKSSEMVRQIQRNASHRGVSIEAYHCMWADLAKRFGRLFDAVYCRGNSLVYAASWEQNWFVPARSHEEIERAVKNFYEILKPGGILYLDITSRNEKPHAHALGRAMLSKGEAEMTWMIDHDEVNHIRTWTVDVTFPRLGEKKSFPSHSYLLPHQELMLMLRLAGFTSIEQYVPVRGENNYDVFIAKK
jgi:SAM-dependent methyltransferase